MPHWKETSKRGSGMLLRKSGEADAPGGAAGHSI